MARRRDLDASLNGITTCSVHLFAWHDSMYRLLSSLLPGCFWRHYFEARNYLALQNLRISQFELHAYFVRHCNCLCSCSQHSHYRRDGPHSFYDRSYQSHPGFPSENFIWILNCVILATDLSLFLSMKQIQLPNPASCLVDEALQDSCWYCCCSHPL